MQTEIEQKIKENFLMEETRKMTLMVEVPVKKYRKIQAAAKKAEMDVSTFIRNPPLECWCCPLSNGSSCQREVDDYCAGAFAKYLLLDDK